MRIYKLLILLILGISAPAHGNAGFEEFLNSRGVEKAQFDSFAKGSTCLKTPGYMICGVAHDYPNLSGNALASEAIGKSLALSARNKLYEFVRENEKTPIKDSQAASEAFKSASEHKGRIYLKGVEFAVFARADWRAALASIPLSLAPGQAEALYKSSNFKLAYESAMLECAKEKYASGNYVDALAILAELQRFCGKTPDISLMAARVFLKLGQLAEAERVALEIWQFWRPKLDAAQMETLGDIFMAASNEQKALAAYNAALSLGGSLSMR